MLPPDGSPSGYKATPGEPGLPPSPLEGALLLAGALCKLVIKVGKPTAVFASSIQGGLSPRRRLSATGNGRDGLCPTGERVPSGRGMTRPAVGVGRQFEVADSNC